MRIYCWLLFTLLIQATIFYAAKSHKILMKKRARTCVCQKKAVSLHAILIKSI